MQLWKSCAPLKVISSIFYSRSVLFPSVTLIESDYSTGEYREKEHSTTREDSGSPWIRRAPRPCRGSNGLARPTELIEILYYYTCIFTIYYFVLFIFLMVSRHRVLALHDLYQTMTSQTSARRQARRVHDTSGSIDGTRASQSIVKGPESVVSSVGEPRSVPRVAAPASTRRYASPTRGTVSNAALTSTGQLSAATHPPPPNVRTGSPQYQLSEASVPFLPSRGPPAYPDFLSLQETAILQLRYACAGLKDAFRWDHVIQMVIS